MSGGSIQRVVTHGTFELDGGSWEVDNNIWIVGDDNEVVVFDAAHDARPDRQTPSAAGTWSPWSARTATTTTSPSRPNSATRWTHRCCCIRPTTCCGE